MARAVDFDIGRHRGRTPSPWAAEHGQDQGGSKRGQRGTREGEIGIRIACDVLNFSLFCERVGRARAVGFHTDKRIMNEKKIHIRRK